MNRTDEQSRRLLLTESRKASDVRSCASALMQTADLPEDVIRDGGVGVNDDGGHFVITYLLQQGGGVQTVVQHPHRQRLPGDEEAADQLLQSQQTYGAGNEHESHTCLSDGGLRFPVRNTWL